MVGLRRSGLGPTLLDSTTTDDTNAPAFVAAFMPAELSDCEGCLLFKPSCIPANDSRRDPLQCRRKILRIDARRTRISVAMAVAS